VKSQPAYLFPFLKMGDVYRHNSVGPIKKRSRRKKPDSVRSWSNGYRRIALLSCSIVLFPLAGFNPITYKTWIEDPDNDLFRPSSKIHVPMHSPSDTVENLSKAQTSPQNPILSSHVDQFDAKAVHVNKQTDETKPDTQLSLVPKGEAAPANLHETKLDGSLNTYAMRRNTEDLDAALEGRTLKHAVREQSSRSQPLQRDGKIDFRFRDENHPQEHHEREMTREAFQREVADDDATKLSIPNDHQAFAPEEAKSSERDRYEDFPKTVLSGNKPMHFDTDSGTARKPRASFTATFIGDNIDDVGHSRRSVTRSSSNETRNGPTSFPKQVGKLRMGTSSGKANRSAFKGHHVPSSILPVLFRNENTTRVSLYAYRLIKAHRIESMIDLSCTNTKLWMPAVLQYLEFEVPGFQYHCVVDDAKTMREAFDYYKHLSSVEFLVGSEYNLMKFPNVHLALLWNIMGVISAKRVGHMFKGIAKARIKYIFLSNYPLIKKNPTTLVENGWVNVRRTPYKFGQPLRIIQNISVDPSIVKQILFFDGANIKNA
jgi:hypothetical protein